MVATIIETIASRADTKGGGDQDSATLAYMIAHAFDPDEVDLVIELTIPAYYNRLPFQKYSKNHVGNGVWEATAEYAKRAPRKPGMTTFSFDTSGTKEKLTQAIASTYYPKAGEPEIDYQGAINVKTSEGKTKVEGVEVDLPGFTFTVQKTYGPPAHALTGAQVEILYDLKGHVNSDTVAVTISGLAFGFEPGTLRYMGVTGSQKASLESDEFEAEVSLKFAYEPNLVGEEIAGITGVDKKGHEYLWVTYEEESDSTANVLKPVARQVNVEQVFKESELMPLFG